MATAMERKTCMQWGFMTPAHILSLIAAAGMLLGVYFSIRGRSRKIQTAVLALLSLWGIAAIVFNLLRWDCPIRYLPLHLCSVNALLLPFAVVTRNKTLGNLLLVWCLGALAALVMNHEMMTVTLFSEAFIFYYFPHVFEFGVPVLLVKLKLVEKDPRCIGSTLSLTILIYTFVHLCNKLINGWCAAVGSGVRVNYMFSVIPSNPVVALFHRLIPYEYWYMYLVLPIVAGYLLILYGPQLRQMHRIRTKTKLRRKTA